MEVFDREAFNKRCVGDEELEREIMDGSIPTIPDQLKRIEEAFRAGDAYKLEREAHGLKGTSGTLSALALQQSAQDIEVSAKSGEVSPDIENSIAEAHRSFDEFLKKVEEEGLYTSDSGSRN